jgi:acyl carrier protein
MISDKRLQEVIRSVFGIEPEDIALEEKFNDMSIWDSMTFMRFIIEIEEKYSISLSNQEILEMDCMKNTIEILAKRESPVSE